MVLVLHPPVALHRPPFRQLAQHTPTSTRDSHLATRDTSPPTLTIPTPTAARMPDQLDQFALKTTPESLRRLEMTWRTRRKAKLAEMREENAIERCPSERVVVTEEVEGRIIENGQRNLGDRQTNGKSCPRIRGLTRQANVLSNEETTNQSVLTANTGGVTMGGKVVEEPGRIQSGSYDQHRRGTIRQPAGDEPFTTTRHTNLAKNPAKKVRCELPTNVKSEKLPRIATTAQRINYDLLPIGTRRISDSNVFTIQQESSFSTSINSLAQSSSRRLTFSTAYETYRISEDGMEMIVEDGRGGSLKTKRIKLEQQEMWERKDRKRWELVFDIVNRINRHTKRVRDIIKIKKCLPRRCLKLILPHISDYLESPNRMPSSIVQLSTRYRISSSCLPTVNLQIQQRRPSQANIQRWHHNIIFSWDNADLHSASMVETKWR